MAVGEQGVLGDRVLGHGTGELTRVTDIAHS
jgi:hypothetical protein